MAESEIAHKTLRLLLAAYVATVNWCGIPCVKTARSISGLDIPKNAVINTCKLDSEIIHAKVNIVLTLNDADYTRVRAEAARDGYSDIRPLGSREGFVDFIQYYGETGLLRESFSSDFKTVLLRDSTRQIIIEYSDH